MIHRKPTEILHPLSGVRDDKLCILIGNRLSYLQGKFSQDDNVACMRGKLVCHVLRAGVRATEELLSSTRDSLMESLLKPEVKKVFTFHLYNALVAKATS
ncbi:hypothetical protein [Helicobacter marmotae]|uniref:hypothetical protein n=1 Tax=Helicobacter marmotae TaxID=152490 RepID=UPI0011C071D2|nr:hypothetical protein [Helicobacter marmotae]